jgi:tight adherence protein B
MAGVDRARTLLAGFGSTEGLSKEPSREARSSVATGYFSKLYTNAGLSAEDGSKFQLKAIVSAALVGGVLGIVKLKFGIAGFLLVLLFSYLKLKGLVGKRAEAFERDYPTFLLSLASAVRTGLDPIQAFTDSANLFTSSSELRKELALTKVKIESGFPEEESIRNFASSIAHPDIDLFRTGFILARKEGSSLGECLERLARVTRARQTFRRKIKSAVAMQKLSAVGVGGCALLVLAIQFVSNPESFTKTLSHSAGRAFLALGALLVVGGIAWMFRMTRGRV